MKKIGVPLLIMHGSDDHIVPFENSGKGVHDMIPSSTLEIIEGGPHGITATHPDEVNKKLIAFISAQ